jgi:hypothetical protein
MKFGGRTYSEIVVAGVPYYTAAAAAAAAGLSRDTVKYRLSKGIPLETPKQRAPRSITVGGVTYPSERAAAAANGVSPYYFGARRHHDAADAPARIIKALHYLDKYREHPLVKESELISHFQNQLVEKDLQLAAAHRQLAADQNRIHELEQKLQEQLK